MVYVYGNNSPQFTQCIEATHQAALWQVVQQRPVFARSVCLLSMSIIRTIPSRASHVHKHRTPCGLFWVHSKHMSVAPVFIVESLLFQCVGKDFLLYSPLVAPESTSQVSSDQWGVKQKANVRWLLNICRNISLVIGLHFLCSPPCNQPALKMPNR